MADNVELQGLEFQIVNDSAAAVKGMEALSTTLERLKKATSGGTSGLSRTATGISQISNALKSFNSSEAGVKIRELAVGLETLKGVGKVTISASIANQITAISSALSGVNTDTKDKLTGLADGLRPLSELGKSRLTTFINQLKKLPEVTQELEKVDMDKFTKQMQDLTAAMKPLADEMQKVSNGFSAFPAKIQRLITSTQQGRKSVGAFGKATGALKLGGFIVSLRTAANWIGKAITLSNKYQEDLNLFTASTGKYAAAAQEYAENVSEVMGIDPAEWMRNQGVFMTLATGLGTTSDKAALMSKNLTQLGYDISSFFNISTENAMQKLQSAMSGELEPVRRLGYALSQNSLQELYGKEVVASVSKDYKELESALSDTGLAQLAVEMGFNRNISTMTEAEKVQLRYIALMKQNTVVQGDMARSLEAPANQLRISQAQFTMAARAIGNIFIPILNKILPVAIAVLQVIRDIANAIAALFGFQLTEIDYSGLDNATSSAGGLTDELGNASSAAKELKKYLAGFDELNVMPSNTSGGGSGAGASGGGGFGFELPEYNFLGEELNKNVSELKGKLEDILPLIAAAGVGFLAWKLSKNFMGQLNALTIAVGLTLLIDSIICTFKDGLSWKSVIEGAIGGALLGAGIGFKLGGWKGAIGGVVIGIGVSLVINGITSMFAEGVSAENVISTITGALTTVLGIIGVCKAFNSKAAQQIPEVETANTTVQTVDSKTSALLGKLKTLAKTLGWGLVILGEVAAAAIIFVGAIAVVGWELDKVGQAWQPVINNAGTVATAVGIGTGVLALVGAACYALGTLGGAVALNIGVGILVLAELGVATGLFLVEIWAIGKALDEIGKAWQPVLNNGEEIATAIGIGTGLLVGVGVVTAALGAVTVASAGTLPVAIAIGTAVLLEVSEAFVAFTKELVKVADELNNNLHPALKRLNPKIPQVTSNAKNFTKLIAQLAGVISDYTRSMGSITWDSIVSGFRKLFAKDPIKSFANSVEDIYSGTQTLNKKLTVANKELKSAVTLMSSYTALMKQLQDLSGKNGSFNLPSSIYTNLKEAGAKLVTGWADGMTKNAQYLKNAVSSLNRTAFGSSGAWDNGYKYGQSFAKGLAKAIKGYTFPTIKGNVTTSGSQAQIKLKAYASGGFPDEGELFIAREAGAEMVGSIGRRAAVANNDQIVEAISAGVYQAVRNANGGNGAGNRNTTVVAQCDGKTLFKIVVDENNKVVRTTGTSPLYA